MADNSNLVVPVFKNHAVYNEAESRKAGRPIFDDMEIIEISFAGDRQKKAVFPAHEPEPNATREAAANGEPPVTYAQVYGKQYQAFKMRGAQTVSGTPLSELVFLTEAQRSELRALNIHTAEALAQLDGTPLRALGMGGRERKNMARAYLETARHSATATDQAALIADLQARLAEQEETIRTLGQGGKPPAVADEVDEPEGGGEGGGQPEGTPDFEAMTDAEIKAWIKANSSDPVRGNPSRETLLERATEIATRPDGEE